MNQMAAVSAIWARIAGQWDAINALLVEEMGENLTGKEAPQTYALLSSLTTEGA